MTDDREPETLDETYQRLSPYSGSPQPIPGPPPPPVPPRVYGAPAPDPVGLPSSFAPPPPESGFAPLSPQGFDPAVQPAVSERQPKGLTAGLAIVGAGALVVILLAAGGVAFVASGPPGQSVTGSQNDPDDSTSTDDSDPNAAPVPIGPDIVDEWSTYPGSAFEDSAAVIAGPSKEQVVTDSEAFLEEFTSTLTDDLGVKWDQRWTGLLDHGSNGYGGDSLLYDYYSPEWVGEVKLDDPTSRQQVHDLLKRMLSDAGAEPMLFSNGVYEDDPEYSREQFGAAEIDDQAMWSLYGRNAIVEGMSISSRVYDTNLPTDKTFTGDTWFAADTTKPDILYVKIQLSAYGLLSKDDRDEFEKLIAGYDENAKPEPR